MNKKKEVDYYPEIVDELIRLFNANLNQDLFKVAPVIGEISSGLRTLIANGLECSEALKSYAQSVHRLYLDIAILVENKQNHRFEVIIFEIKLVPNLGLSELSQLIGYCLVSKAKFGILMNVDKAVSRNFSVILDGDKHLTTIYRIIDDKPMLHQFGVMVWNPNTLKIEYTNAGSIQSIPQLIDIIETNLS